MDNLTPKEAAFLLSLLANMQISGKPHEVREMLAQVESIMAKLGPLAAEQ